MILHIPTKNARTIASPTLKRPRPTPELQATLLHHSFPYLIPPPTLVSLLLKGKRNITDKITFAPIMAILSTPSKLVPRLRRRITSFKILLPIQTNPRCLMSITPSHTLPYYIQYLHTLSVHLLVRKTGSLDLHGCRGTETCYYEIYIHICYFESCPPIGFYSGLLLTSDDRLWSNSQFYPRVHRSTIILENNPVSNYSSYPCRWQGAHPRDSSSHTSLSHRQCPSRGHISCRTYWRSFHHPRNALARTCQSPDRLAIQNGQISFTFHTQ